MIYAILVLTNPHGDPMGNLSIPPYTTLSLEKAKEVAVNDLIYSLALDEKNPEEADALKRFWETKWTEESPVLWTFRFDDDATGNRAFAFVHKIEMS